MLENTDLEPPTNEAGMTDEMFQSVLKKKKKSTANFKRRGWLL